MDDELCDTVMMGAVHLQAAFSVVAPRFAIHPKGFERDRHDGAHLSKGCTSGTTDVWCVSPFLRVLRSTTRRAAHSEHNLHSTPSATCTTCCDPYTTVLVQQ
jgi:hypothetical protein